MPRRPLAVLAASSTMLALASSAKAETVSDLGAAFQAAFGHPAPITRHVERPQYYIDSHKLAGYDPQVMDLWPERLVRVDGNRWALISKEYARNWGHSTQGAIAIAYLHPLGDGWTLEHLWPEVAYSGVSGEPANVGEEVRQFGSAPLYLTTGEWCGMGSCSDAIDAISLTPTGPVDLGEVMGGGEFSAEEAFSDPEESSCKDYAYTAVVGPPSTATGVFSVTYEGWTLRPKARTTKAHFHLKADAVPDGNGLALRPKIPVPDCGR